MFYNTVVNYLFSVFKKQNGEVKQFSNNYNLNNFEYLQYEQFATPESFLCSRPIENIAFHLNYSKLKIILA